MLCSGQRGDGGSEDTDTCHTVQQLLCDFFWVVEFQFISSEGAPDCKQTHQIPLGMPGK